MITKPTTKHIEAYLATVRAIADAIKEFGSTPAGPLYAAVMGRMDLDTFTGIIGRLVGAGLVKQSTGHVLTWIGPK